MKIIIEKIRHHLKVQLPFVVYNKPNDLKVSALFQKDDTLNCLTNKFDKEGFVFAPFHNEHKTILIPVKNAEYIESSFSQNLIELEAVTPIDSISKSNHEKLVAKGISAIKKGFFKKVVLSRKEEVIIDNIEIIETYQKLLQTYPNAFVYMWFHPKVGLWLGATPETLLSLKDNCFTTMALAGTQVFDKNIAPSWSKKEIDEQQFVTDYIENKLTDFSKEIKFSETRTVKAGSLIHLCTDITGKLDETKQDGLFSLINLLHPTPAVCGLPKGPAKQFILASENYDRSYYTGYLGELNMQKNDVQLYVNLRCMEIIKNKVGIYVGGGITAESNPEKEWEETVSKSKVMLKVL